jgi:hypothetical protein
MAAHLYDYAGVTLHVDYTLDTEDGVPTINSVRVLDATYAPCGPDLVDWLQRLVFMHTPTNGEAMLSIIVGEIYDATDCH